VSDLFPHLRECMDDICLIRSMNSNDNEHYQATLGIHTGSFFFSRPSIGSWISYGLGTSNQNLPSFVAISAGSPYAGTQIFNNDFLPAYHQGVRVVPGKEPIANLDRRTQQASLQELELGLAEALNKKHLDARGHDTELAARIRTFETAFHMQTEARDVFDLSQETDETLALYGMKRGQTALAGRASSDAGSLSAECASWNWWTAAQATTGTNTATWPSTRSTRRTSTNPSPVCSRI
jgi:hypothetical protein